jgi:hypothetical protein
MRSADCVIDSLFPLVTFSRLVEVNVTMPLLPLDDCLYALQATIPHLTRSSLHRCLQRHGIGRLPKGPPGG